MGTNNLAPRAAGQTILASFFEDIKSRLIGDFVGMDTSGNAVSGQNLGNSAYPWGTAYITSLVLGGQALSTSQLETQSYKIVSGKTRSASNQPQFLQPAGTSASFNVLATSVNLQLQIAGVTATWTADKNSIAVTTAPSSGNTATVNDSTAAGQSATRTWGEYGSGTPYYAIAMSSVGANISARAGSIQAFKIGTEYFIGYINASGNAISHCFRGFFFDSSGNPIKRTTFSNGATITLCNLGYVFLDSDGVTADVIFVGAGVNHTPEFGYSAPSGSTGDYWYDLGNQVWKRYSGSAWVIVNRTLVGLVVADTSNCVGARSFDFWALTRADNNIELEVYSASNIIGSGMFQRLSVNGKRIDFSMGSARPIWNMSSTLASSSERYNAAVQPSSTEYLYVADTGQCLTSDIEPYWRPDLLGWYHPYNPWRAVGFDTTDSGTSYVSSTLYSYLNFGNGCKAVMSGSDIKLPGRLLCSGNRVVSSSSGAFSIASNLATDVTNLSNTLTTKGNPVECFLQPDGTSNPAWIGAAVSSSPLDSNFYVYLLKDGSIIARWQLTKYHDGTASTPFSFPSLRFIDFSASAGSHTYKIQVQRNNASTTVYVEYCVLVTKELHES